jgi:hypothetical protein
MSKYPRTLHLPWSKGLQNDDRMAESVSSLVGVDIVITEKLDGSNTSLTKDGVYGRSHVDFTKNPWDVKSWELWNRIKNDIDKDIFIFGEGMYGIHSILYSNLKSYFYIFGVRDNNIWVSWDQVDEYSFLLDIPTVPVLFKGVVNSEKELKTLTEDLTSKPSELGGVREGIVVRNANMFHNDDFSSNVMKWVRKGHVQTDEHWTRNWKKATINYDL